MIRSKLRPQTKKICPAASKLNRRSPRWGRFTSPVLEQDQRSWILVIYNNAPEFLPIIYDTIYKFTSMKIEEISCEITCACNEIRMWIQKRFYPVMLPAKAQFCYELMASNIAECWFVTFLALFMTNLSRSENYNFLFKVLIRFPSKFEECIVNIFTWNSFHIQ